MRRFPTTTLCLVAAAIAIVGGWLIFAKSEHARFLAVDRVRHSKSAFHLTYTVDHATGPAASETWDLRNVDGRSVASYAVSDRSGSVARFDEDITNYDVTFLFERLVQDGIWDLQSRPFRGKSQDLHTVRIEQTADTQSGTHRFSFTDPHYIATSAGREFHIHLDPHKPVPDLLTLQSTSTADPRYQKIVDDFEQFGSPRFKATVIAAREKLLRVPGAKG